MVDRDTFELGDTSWTLLVEGRAAGLGEREPLSLPLLGRLGFSVNASAHGQPTGRVFSVDPDQGDPRFVAVLPDGDRDAFRVDRRTMRIFYAPRTSMVSENDVVRAADLADRAQLALGEPVAMRFGFADDKIHVTHIERLSPRLSFTALTYRRVAPFIGDKSTLAPLSVDALDRALRAEEDRGDEHRVRRIFGRAYRKVDALHTPWSRGGRGRLGTAQRLLRHARDVGAALSDARRYRMALAESIAEQDVPALSELDLEDLVEALRRRMSLVVSALVLLERSRMATLSLLPLLERVTDVVPRGAFATLAAPVYTSERLAIDNKLLSLATLVREHGGRLEKPRDEAVRGEWERVQRTLRHVRCLGMDVRGAPIGSDDEQLLLALYEVSARYAQDPESARRKATRELQKHGLFGTVGPAGVVPAASMATLLTRLAEAKGHVAEGLSAALLRLRAAALDAGRRLSHAGMLERPDDTLFMTLEEIEQALEGELGAYAARARLRREDDRRWRHFDAPVLIPGRAPPGPGSSRPVAPMQA